MHCVKCFFYEGDVGDETCARCGRAFLPEANVYLGLLLVVTGGLAWALRSLLALSPDLFVRPTLDLGAWAAWPPVTIGQGTYGFLVACPAYGFVMGGFLAMLTATPIMTAVLYGKRGGWLLCLCTAILGPSVLVAAVSAFGVWMAGGHTLRLTNKLASGMLGLAPAVVYWIGVTWQSDVPNLSPTLDSLRYVAPLAATAFGAAAVALVVAVGRADRWHVRWPGAILSVFTIGPVLALLATVGLDRIRYEMLPRPGESPIADLVAEYGAFLARYPRAETAARARAELALALEQARAQAPQAAQTPTPAPTPADPLSAQYIHYLWSELLEQSPGSPWAVDARLHLADFAAAQGLFGEAERFYQETADRTTPERLRAAFGLKPSALEDDPLADFTPLKGLFTVGRRLQAKETARRLEGVRRQAMMHLALLRENRRPAGPADRALALYFAALTVRGTSRFPDALLKAREADPDGPVADNVAMELALFEAIEDKRVEGLKAVAARYPKTDGAMRALLAAAETLVPRGPADPAALPAARDLLLAVQADLAARRQADPDDPYVAALGDLVEKKISYVQSQIGTPEGRP